MSPTARIQQKEWFQHICRQHNLKITPQRITIYEALLSATDHPSADDIFQRVKKTLPHISFDTVYRTLLSFSQIGILALVEGYGETKRFDPNIMPHHHLRCLRCHKIVDFLYGGYDALEVPDIVADRDFQIVNKRVVLEGICAQCSKKG